MSADLLVQEDGYSDIPNRTRRMSRVNTTRRKSLYKTMGLQNTQIFNAGRRLTRAVLLDLPDEKEKPKIQMENTYKMNPDVDKQFSAHRVKSMVSDVFEEYLDDVEYDARTCGKLVCDISQDIRGRVKELNFARYKIVVNVVIGQCSAQGLEVASRCVWDSKTDTYTCVTYKNKSVFAVANIYGLFLE